MKKFLFLSYGFETPTPEVMDAWGSFFGTISDRIVEQVGLGAGKEFTKSGTTDLSPKAGAATGYIIIKAASLEEAEQLMSACPIIERNAVQEIVEIGDC
jgi:hypothetical protein